MPRALQPVLFSGIIDHFIGLSKNEEYRIIPFGLVRRGVLSQEYADWLFENEPLTSRVVVVVAVNGDAILRHRAAFDVEFAEPVSGENDLPDALAALRPRRHPDWLPD